MWKTQKFVVRALALVVAASACNGDPDIDPKLEKLQGQELVDYIYAQPGLTFKGYCRAEQACRRHAILSAQAPHRRGPLLHQAHVGPPQKPPRRQQACIHITATIPESFDSRTQWANCPFIGTIRDQSHCGSCWAFGAVEVMSDRICISSEGKTIVNISASDLLSCCGLSCGRGCGGAGDPLSAWRYWISFGIVTGSNFADKTGCKPYDFPECEHHMDGGHYGQCDALPYYDTPDCKKSCQDGYAKTYAEDKFYGKCAYGIAANVSEIQKEILTNGPIEAFFDVYEDWEHYKGGIYQHTAGPYLGGHAVRVLGWGVENGIPFWNVANSWNGDWGESGYFRIIRGKNECGFEEAMVAGLPKL